MGAVSWELEDGIGHLRLDDGRANALNSETLGDLEAGLDAVAGARAVVLEGRPERFSAGLDLKVLPTLPQAELGQVLTQFARVCRRLALHPRPVVAAATGHAIAGGAVLLLCCDHRVGAAGDFKVGLSEVAIGIPLPTFVMVLAERTLSRKALRAATLHGALYGPEEACSVGFLDQVRPPGQVAAAAREEALRLAELTDPAYSQTKARFVADLDAAIARFLPEMGAFFTDEARRHAARFR